MWCGNWPTAWIFLAPVMMLACMAGMFFMMRGMLGRRHPSPIGAELNGIKSTHTGPIVARFPEGQPAFEEYRAETLRRLDQEQKEFQDFLDRLRRAKDKAEFEQFMAERRVRVSA